MESLVAVNGGAPIRARNGNGNGKCPVFAYDNRALADQVVEYLTDVWRPELVPDIFRILGNNPLHPSSYQQSDWSSLAYQHSYETGYRYPSSHLMGTPSLSTHSHSSEYNYNNEISEFVYHTLRRTVTTTDVLQDAFCYIKKLREKLPELSNPGTWSGFPAQNVVPVEVPGQRSLENTGPFRSQEATTRDWQVPVHQAPLESRYTVSQTFYDVSLPENMVSSSEIDMGFGQSLSETCYDALAIHNQLDHFLTIPQVQPSIVNDLASTGILCAEQLALPTFDQFVRQNVLCEDVTTPRPFTTFGGAEGGVGLKHPSQFADMSDYNYCSTPKASETHDVFNSNSQSQHIALNGAVANPWAEQSATYPSNHLQFDNYFSLPSPLFCPRRTFLAALILATKFNYDINYTNRSWATLCGFELNEINRSERALGEALEWRLWVRANAVLTCKPESNSIKSTASKAVHSNVKTTNASVKLDSRKSTRNKVAQSHSNAVSTNDFQSDPCLSTTGRSKVAHKKKRRTHTRMRRTEHSDTQCKGGKNKRRNSADGTVEDSNVY